MPDPAKPPPRRALRPNRELAGKVRRVREQLDALRRRRAA
jgi:hypothetical protein